MDKFTSTRQARRPTGAVVIAALAATWLLFAVPVAAAQTCLEANPALIAIEASLPALEIEMADVEGVTMQDLRDLAASAKSLGIDSDVRAGGLFLGEYSVGTEIAMQKDPINPDGGCARISKAIVSVGFVHRKLIVSKEVGENGCLRRAALEMRNRVLEEDDRLIRELIVQIEASVRAASGRSPIAEQGVLTALRQRFDRELLQLASATQERLINALNLMREPFYRTIDQEFEQVCDGRGPAIFAGTGRHRPI